MFKVTKGDAESYVWYDTIPAKAGVPGEVKGGQGKISTPANEYLEVQFQTNLFDPTMLDPLLVEAMSRYKANDL